VDSCANKGWASSKLDWVHLLLLFLSTLTMKSTITQEERLVKGMFVFFFVFFFIAANDAIFV
jgi:hypothetical protein